MKAAALLGLMDEVDLLPRCLEHLARIGVDSVVVRDGGSTDGGLQWLEPRQGDRLRVEPVTAHEMNDQAACSRRDVELARATGADWVIFLDADEFWLPAAGRLLEGEPWRDETVDAIRVPRFNIALGQRGPLMPQVPTPDAYSSLWMFTRAIAGFRGHLERHPLTPWITGVPVPKFAVRPHRVHSLLTGWHGALGADDSPLAVRPAQGLIAAHLPFDTLARFGRKVDNIRRMLAKYPDTFGPNEAWHWRRWAALDSPTALEQEFARQRLTEAELATLRSEGALRSAAQLLASA